MEPVNKTIRGVTFEVTPVPAGKARSALTRLARLVAPVVANVLDGTASQEDVNIGDLDAGALLREAAGALREEDVDYFCDLFASHCRVASDPENPQTLVPLSKAFDETFTRRYALMISWLYACLEVNFADFFDGPAFWQAVRDARST